MTLPTPFQRYVRRLLANLQTDSKASRSIATRRRSRGLAVEQLEARTLLSVTFVSDPANPGKNIVTFNEDVAGNSDNLTLQLNTSGQLQYKLNNAAFTNDLKSAVGGLQALPLGQISRIDVSLGGGNDVLTIDNLNGLVDPSPSGVHYIGGAGVDTFVMQQAANFTLTDTSLTRSIGGPIFLSGIEQASLTIGNFGNTIDASQFSGNTTLLGGNSKDILIGGRGNDYIDGGNGGDVLTGGGGTNTLVGGNGPDSLVEQGDFNFAITNASTAPTIPPGPNGQVCTDLVVNNDIEQVSLTGGAGDNAFYVGGFIGLAPTTIDGGDATTGQNSIFATGSGSTSTSVDPFTGNTILTVGGGGVFTTKNINNVNVAGVPGSTTNDNLDFSTYTGTVVVSNLGGGTDNVIGGKGKNIFKKNFQDHGNKTFIGGPQGSKNEFHIGPGSTVQIISPNALPQDNSLSFDLATAGVNFDVSQNSGQMQAVSTINGETNYVAVTGTFDNISGSSFNDTLSTAGATDLNLAGGGGNDTFTINPTSIDGLGNDTFTISNSTFTGGTGNDTFVINGASSANDTFTINNSTFSGGGGVGNDTFTISGGASNDTFTISNTTFTSAGANDTFTINGNSAVNSNDTFTISNTTFAGAGSINGGAGNDTFVINNSSFGTANDTFTINGGTGADSFLIGNGSGANDTFTINGSIAGLGNDTFTIGSTGVGNDTFTIGSISAGVSGVFNIGNSGSGNDTFTIGSISGGIGNDTFTIGNTGIGNDTFTIGGIDSGAGNDTFTINGGASNDTFTITNGIMGEGNDTFLINVLGSASGNDTFTINGSFLGGAGNDTFVIQSLGGTGTSNDTFTMNGSLLGGIGNDTFTMTNNSPGNDTFTINGSVTSGAGNDTFTIGSSGVGNDTFVITGGLSGSGSDTFTIASSGSGNDTFTIGDITAGALNDTFTIGSLGTGNDTFTIGSISGGIGNDTFTIGNSGSGNDTFTINSIAGGFGNDTFVLTSPGSGNDTFTITNGVSGLGNDTFVINNAGSASGNDTFTINSSFTGGSGDNRFFVQDTGTGASNDTFTINGSFLGGIGNDTFVISNPSGTGNDTFTINGGLIGGTGNDTFLINNNGAGNDTFTITNGVSGTGNDTFLISNQGGGNDTFTIGSFTSAGGNDTFVINNVGNGNDTFTIASGIALGDGNDTFTISSPGGGNDTFTISGGVSAGAGNDTFTVSGAGNGSDTFTINGAVGFGDGNNSFIAGLTGGGNDTFTINGALTTGSGNDTFTINGGGTGSDTFTITGGIQAGSGQDTFTINDPGTSAGNDTFTINGNLSGTGSDTFNITSGLDSHAGQDTFTINGSLTGGPLGDTFLISNTGDGNDTFTITGGLIGGAGNDTFELSGSYAGATSLVGAAGNDTYSFYGTLQGNFLINENALPGVDNSVDTLDFSSLSNPIHVDISLTTPQLVAPGLTLQLSDAAGIENVIGTAQSDYIHGNARNGVLKGSAALDDRYVPGAPGPGANGQAQVVFLDFDTETGLYDFNTFYGQKGVTPEHVYSAQERAAILQGIKDDYQVFGTSLYVTANLADAQAHAGPGVAFVTEYFNKSVPNPDPNNPLVPGGTSDDLDFRNTSYGGTANIQVNGILGEPGQPPDTTQNWVTLSTKIAAHELGHLLGLRHEDAFGAIGDGIHLLPNNADGSSKNYNPVYPGPLGASETYNHIISSGDSVGSDRWNDLRGLFFGEREDIKLAFAFAAPATPADGTLLVAEHGVETSTTPQSVALAPLTVPNTLQYGANAGKTFEVAAVDVMGSLDIDQATGKAQSDFYSFSGRAGDLINIEVMSLGLTRDASLGTSGYIDSVVHLYYKDPVTGQLSPVNYYGTDAVNDDEFEPTDSSLVDVYLPSDGTYVVEVDSFKAPPGTQLPPGFNNLPAETQQNILDAINGTDTGKYELFIDRFKAGVTTDGNDTLVSGSGAESLIGGKGDDAFYVNASAHNVVTGGAGNNTVVGADAANLWSITGPNSGTVNSASFTQIQNLVGGSQADNFALSGGTLGGAINGQGGNNTLTGDNIANTWTITGPGAGSVTGVGVGFSNIQNLKGGTGSDTFRFLGGSIAGTVDGGGGQSAGLFSNPSFESGLQNWSATPASSGGSITAVSSYTAHPPALPPAVFNPIDGASFALLQSGAKDVYSTLSHTFTVHAGDKISGWAFFDTTDKTANNDDGYVVIKQGSTIVATVFAASVSSVGSYNHTPWVRWEFAFSTAGTYSVEAGVRNAKNNLLPSFVGLDAVVLSSLDTLDYSAASAALVVNLALGSATSTGGVLNIQNVIGGAGNDILVGNALDNVLIGGAGADILIGGLGRDYVYGGTGDDILIGGTTSWDMNAAALQAIMAEWSSSHSRATRVSNIQNGGGLNGTFVLNSSTVFDDGLANVLAGGSGMDVDTPNWFFIGKQDTVLKLQSGDTKTNL